MARSRRCVEVQTEGSSIPNNESSAQITVWIGFYFQSALSLVREASDMRSDCLSKPTRSSEKPKLPTKEIFQECWGEARCPKDSTWLLMHHRKRDRTEHSWDNFWIHAHIPSCLKSEPWALSLDPESGPPIHTNQIPCTKQWPIGKPQDIEHQGL